eukprot:CFRG8167T1
MSDDKYSLLSDINDVNVKRVRDVLSLNESKALILLEAYSGDVERAIGAYLDGTTLGNEFVFGLPFQRNTSLPYCAVGSSPTRVNRLKETRDSQPPPNESSTLELVSNEDKTLNNNVFVQQCGINIDDVVHKSSTIVENRVKIENSVQDFSELVKNNIISTVPPTRFARNSQLSDCELSQLAATSGGEETPTLNSTDDNASIVNIQKEYSSPFVCAAEKINSLKLTSGDFTIDTIKVSHETHSNDCQPLTNVSCHLTDERLYRDNPDLNNDLPVDCEEDSPLPFVYNAKEVGFGDSICAGAGGSSSTCFTARTLEDSAFEEENTTSSFVCAMRGAGHVGVSDISLENHSFDKDENCELSSEGKSFIMHNTFQPVTQLYMSPQSVDCLSTSTQCVGDNVDARMHVDVKSNHQTVSRHSAIVHQPEYPSLTAMPNKRKQCSMNEFLGVAKRTRCLKSSSAEENKKSAWIRNREAFLTVPAGRNRKYGFDAYEILARGFLNPIPLHQFQRRTPTSAIRNALPEELATKLLKLIMQESTAWIRYTRVVWNKRVVSPRVTNVYSLAPENVRVDFNNVVAHAESHLYGNQEVVDVERDNEIKSLLADAGRDIGIIVDKLHAERRPKELDRIPMWSPNYVIVNVYRNGQDSTGKHSDSLNVLGPRPIIASLSLGAERSFRLDKVVDQSASGEFGLCDWDESAQTEKDEKFSIKLPHNSLIVMWEGCQESWKHEIRPEKDFAHHQLCGPARINLTFRLQDPKYIARQPHCCGPNKGILKSVFVDGPDQGRYFWSCQDCKYFKWDDEM